MLNGNYAVVISAIFFHFLYTPYGDITMCWWLRRASSNFQPCSRFRVLQSSDKERPVLLLLQKKNDRSCCFFPSRVPIWQPQIACNCRLYNISWRARNLKQCILFFRRDMFSFLQLFIFMQKLIVTKSMYYNLSWQNMHFSPSTLLWRLNSSLNF